jgi:hypothetical protein
MRIRIAKTKSPSRPLVPVELRSGDVADGFHQAAADEKADLIGMATAGVTIRSRLKSR